MNSKTPSESPASLSDAQRTALISLLADEDPGVHQTVRAKLLALGPAVVRHLQPYRLHNDALLRRRSMEIIHHFQRIDSDQRFLSFCESQGEDLDLEKGVGLLAQTRHPEAHLEAFRAMLDQFSAELRPRIVSAISPQQKLLAVNQFLFVEQSFRGQRNYESDPDSAYFNRVLERRTGNPIGMCSVYLLLCKRLSLPVAGIGLPGHFVCRFQSATLELYVDCFNQGRFLTKADCIRHLHSTNHGLHEGYLAPVSTRRILMRMCANLQQTYLQLEQIEDAARLKRYLVALAN